MKPIFKILLTTLLLFGSLSSALAQKIPPQNVKDYFYALPEKFFEILKYQNRYEWMLSHKGAIIDINNGYLYAPGDGAQGSIWVCLFKKKDSRYLVAVQQAASDTDKYTELWFYLYDQGKWKKVTKQLMPTKHNPWNVYQLPRYGHTIKVTNDKGIRLYDWAWNQDKFTLVK